MIVCYWITSSAVCLTDNRANMKYAKTPWKFLRCSVRFRGKNKAAETEKWLFKKKGWRGCSYENRDGGGVRWPFSFRGSFTVYTIFHLYRVTGWCLFRERGLTKKVQGERGRGPAGNNRSQKIYFTPVKKPVFQARTSGKRKRARDGKR